MRFLMLVMLFLASMHVAQAQVLPFGVEPASSILTEVALDEANEIWMYYPNLTQDSILLSWRRIEASMPMGWHANLCDYGQCSTGIPSSGIMNVLAPGQSAYLKLIIQPENIPGSAYFSFRVASVLDPSMFKDIEFQVVTPGYVSVTTPIEQWLEAYPNPVQDMLYLRVPNAQAGEQVSLFDAQGAQVASYSLEAGQKELIFDLRLRQISIFYLLYRTSSGTRQVTVLKSNE